MWWWSVGEGKHSVIFQEVPVFSGLCLGQVFLTLLQGYVSLPHSYSYPWQQHSQPISLKPFPLSICSSPTPHPIHPLTWESKDAEGWHGGEFISLSWDKISELCSGQSFLLESKLLLNGFKMASYPPCGHSLSSTSSEPPGYFSPSAPWESARIPGGKAHKLCLPPPLPKCVLTRNWSHSASGNLSKWPFKSYYLSMVSATGKQISIPVSLWMRLSLQISEQQLTLQC